jgi:hypothetical protein
MEDILDVYCLEYDVKRPQVCMDEVPVQLVKEMRRPVSGKPGQPERYDFEYERNGTANIFMFTEPVCGWRHVSVTERRTAVDWAHEVRELLEVHYPDAEYIRLVMDNLNTHRIASLYEAFEPEEARQLARRLEIHYTPKHGSWLNIAEVELSALSTQCLSQRIPDIETLTRKASAWETSRNQKQKAVLWRFTTPSARIKLERLYPQIKT